MAVEYFFSVIIFLGQNISSTNLLQYLCSYIDNATSVVYDMIFDQVWRSDPADQFLG